MACPRCDGYDRLPLESGSFRCTSQRLAGAILRGQPGNMTPSDLPVYEPCGRIYTREEEASHDALRRAKDDKEQAEADRWEADTEQSRARREGQIEAWLAAIDDPIERDLQLARLGRRPPEIAGLAHWFISRARTRGVAPGLISRYRKTLFGNSKQYQEPGWVFPCGSTTPSGWQYGGPASIALNVDGQWLIEPNYEPGGRYSSVVLHEMARLLDLGDPPEHAALPAPSLKTMMRARRR